MQGINWSIVGQRDFNGDGKSDILWRDIAGDVGMGHVATCGSALAMSALAPIVFSNSGSERQALRDHPCRAHCSLRGRGVPSA